LRAGYQAERKVESLAAYLASGTRNDREKARAAYRWIVENIEYDVSSLRSGRFRTEQVTPQMVLDRRRAVCDGYARLFEALGVAMGLDVRRVEGDASSPGSPAGSSTPRSKSHAWNAVRINGKWMLLDSTWGAGYTNEDRFVRRIDDYYFLTPPRHLIATHFPDDSSWQLLSPPVSRSALASAPWRWSRFFKYNMELASHAQRSIAAGSVLEVTLRHDRGATLFAEVSDGASVIEHDRVTVVDGGDRSTIRISFPRAGRYRLDVLAKAREDKGGYRSAVSYAVVAASGGNALFARHGEASGDHGWGVPNLSAPASNSKPYDIAASVQKDVTVLAQLVDASGKILPNRVLAQPESGRYRFLVTVPKPGKYELQVFSKQARDSAYRFAFTQPIAAASWSDLVFPTVTEAYKQRETRHLSPVQGRLRSGATELFDIDVPQAMDVAVKIGNDWQYLERSGSRFRGNVRIDRGPIVVLARFDAGKNYSPLLVYESH
jgi:hypothetical protein